MGTENRRTEVPRLLALLSRRLDQVTRGEPYGERDKDGTSDFAERRFSNPGVRRLGIR
jgi:hypothetical protein